ncbi:PhzF family phenazine biosynthesis protein [Actinoallomurus acanthiterrae]
MELENRLGSGAVFGSANRLRAMATHHEAGSVSIEEALITREFRQVDVFTHEPYRGNPVAVVLDGEGLSAEEMQRFARWTNLSETTFVLPPTVPDADYRVRIFTPARELPFAGHPTLGTCHVWLSATGDQQRDVVVQECGAGLVTVRRTGDGLAFAAPPLVRSGAVDETLVRKIAAILGIGRDEIVDAQWADNGPGWVAVLLADADASLSPTSKPRTPRRLSAATPATMAWETTRWSTRALQ